MMLQPNNNYTYLPSVHSFWAGYILTSREKKANNNFLNKTQIEIKESKNSLNPQFYEQLVVLIGKNQDRDAFKTVFEYYAPRIKSHLLGFNLPDAKAEGLTQDVFLILWRKANQFDPKKAKLSTWLFRIARNKFIDHSRQQKYPHVNADDHLNDMVSPDESDRAIHQKQISSQMNTAMMGLKPDLKKIIELSFYKYMSHGQIAAKLDLPLGTVKSRIRTAFKLLREDIGEYE